MSFNRRGEHDRRPERSGDGPRNDQPYQPRSGRPFQPRGGRPFQPRGDRPTTRRPRFDRAADEGGMSIRLDPRRLGILKRMAADAGVRPGDLVVRWIEERLDSERAGPGATPISLAAQLAALTARVEALEAARGTAVATRRGDGAEPGEAVDGGTPDRPAAAALTEVAAQVDPNDVQLGASRDSARGPRGPRATRKVGAPRTKGGPAGGPAARVPLHEEIIAVIAEHGPMTAADLATAVVERGRYTPPRSGKPIDAAMINQRVSNPTYRFRFTRDSGRIGLAP